MARNIIPFLLLAVAVVVALTMARAPTPSASAAAVSAPAAATAPQAPPSRSTRSFDDPPLDERELRESRIHIAHEECEEGAKRINVLMGKPPTDPQGIHFLGSCIQHGNVAWYKCILQAPGIEQVAACNRRLLVGDNLR